MRTFFEKHFSNADSLTPIHFSARRIIFINVVFLFSITAVAQTLSPRKKAFEDIVHLKNGTLLVRLATGEHVVKAYKEIAREDLAVEAATKIAEKNKRIAEAFKNNFTFCKVHFFYSNYSEYVLTNELSKIVFLNYTLSPDGSAKPDSNFFIAEFATIEADTAGYWEFYTNKNRSEEGKREARLYAGGNSSISALIIKSNKFVQLRKPFPYFVKYHPEREQEKEINLRVKMLNDKLTDFYTSNNLD